MNELNHILTAIDRSWPAALLKKAETYLRQGKVDELEEVKPGSWIAFVRDKKDFDVQIQLAGAEVTGCACDCGAETMPCEHAAAVLLALRDRFAVVPARPARKTQSPVLKKPTRKKKETFEDILNRVQPEELKSFIKEAFGRQRDFRNLFMARFAEPDNAQGREGYTRLVKNILRSGVSRWGYIDGRGMRKINKPMNELIKQAQIQIDKHQFTGPVQLGQALLEVISERFATDTDDSGYLQGYIHAGVSFFKKTFANPYAAQALKAGLWDYLLEQCPDPKYLEYGGTFHGEIMQILVDFSQAGEPETRLHTVLDKQLARIDTEGRKDYNWEFQRNYWLRWKIALYRKLERSAAAIALLDANLHVPEFRRIKVDLAIEAGRWDEALALLHEGISLAQLAKHPGTVTQWKVQLLRIARLRNDRDEIRKMALELFRTDRYRLEYFKIIKASYPPAEWPAVARPIIAELEKRDYIAEYLLPVLEEEQDWPRMLACIRREARFNMLLRYETPMLEYFPEESEQLYVQWLRETADQASNRDGYQQVVALLQNLAKYPNGKENTALLVREFRERHKRRYAMLEELDKVK